MAAYWMLFLILNFKMFCEVELDRCNGFNLNSCTCEQTYMFCDWISFGNTPPSAETTQTKVLFIDVPGTIGGFYSLRTWPRLESISTLNKKYSCRDGLCRESFPNLKTEVSSTETLTVMYTKTDAIQHPQVSLLTKKKSTSTELNRSFTQIISSTPSSFEKTITGYIERLATFDTNTVKKDFWETLTPTLKTLKESTNNSTETLDYRNHSATFQSTQLKKALTENNSHHWKIAFICVMVFFFIVIIFLVLIIILVYRRLKLTPRRPNTIFNDRYERWQFDDISL